METVQTRARAIFFNEDAFDAILKNTDLTDETILEHYVEHPLATYYFVLDFPRGDGTVFWAIVPDFTFDEKFEFVHDPHATRFTEIIKK